MAKSGKDGNIEEILPSGARYGGVFSSRAEEASKLYQSSRKAKGGEEWGWPDGACFTGGGNLITDSSDTNFTARSHFTLDGGGIVAIRPMAM